MGKFLFKLDSLLNVKKKLEDAQKIEYGKAIARLENEKMKLDMIKKQKAQNILNMKNSVAKYVKPSFMQTVNTFINALNVKIEEQKECIKKADDEVKAEKEKLLQAMKERKILESLEEKEKEKYIVEMMKKEQKNIDEIVSYKYNKV